VFTPCNLGDPVDPIEETSTANNGLAYNALTDTYTYVWKTSKNWKGKCGAFTPPVAIRAQEVRDSPQCAAIRSRVGQSG